VSIDKLNGHLKKYIWKNRNIFEKRWTKVKSIDAFTNYLSAKKFFKSYWESQFEIFHQSFSKKILLIFSIIFAKKAAYGSDFAMWFIVDADFLVAIYALKRHSMRMLPLYISSVSNFYVAKNLGQFLSDQLIIQNS